MEENDNNIINNMGEIKEENINCKVSGPMIDDESENTQKSQKERNPFELVSNRSKETSSNISNSGRTSSINRSDLYGRLSIRMQKRLSRYGNDDEDLLINFSSRHTAYLFSIWIVFIIVFITGFIVHFETDNNVTASSILWTFSGVIMLFGIIYSYLYYKCYKAKNNQELYKYLRFIPC